MSTITSKFSQALLIAFLLFWLPGTCRASLIIYYDAGDEPGPGVRFANMLMNLAGHFDPKIETADVAGYQAGQLSKFDAAIYIGFQGHALPSTFLADVLNGKQRVLWIAANFDQLATHAGPAYPLSFKVIRWDPGSGYSRLDYQGRILIRQGDCSFFVVQYTGQPKIYARLSAEDRDKPPLPYFLSEGRFFYLAENPLPFQSEDRLLIFADLLHEFFQTGKRPAKQAMVRLEDLAPGVSNVTRLRAITDEFAKKGIPFSFSVTPIYKDPEGKYGPAGRTVRLRDDPAFVETLKYMRQRGGVLVMHGVTHQHGKGISREDWEFVQGTDLKPLAYDSEKWARRRILEGLSEFWSQGLDPMIWETPHYSASHGDYRVFAEYFSTFFERPLIFPLRPEDKPRFGAFLSPGNQLIPYYTPVSSLGAGLLPETLGYIDSRQPESAPPALLEKAEKISIVRDGVVSVFFHHDVTSDADINAVIDPLLKNGYTFVSPEQFLKDKPKSRSACQKAKAKFQLFFMRLGNSEF